MKRSNCFVKFKLWASTITCSWWKPNACISSCIIEYCQPFAKQNLIKLVKCYNWLKNKSTYVWIAATAVGYYVYVVTVCCGPGNKSDTIVDFGRKQLHCVTDCRLGSAALLWETEKFTEEKMKNFVWAWYLAREKAHKELDHWPIYLMCPML